MNGKGPVYASPSQVRAAEGLPPDRRLIIKFKRGGTGKMSGNGPVGRKATPRALLSKSLREREHVAQASTARHAANHERRLHPSPIIW